VGRDATS